MQEQGEKRDWNMWQRLKSGLNAAYQKEESYWSQKVRK